MSDPALKGGGSGARRPSGGGGRRRGRGPTDRRGVTAAPLPPGVVGPRAEEGRGRARRGRGVASSAVQQPLKVAPPGPRPSRPAPPRSPSSLSTSGRFRRRGASHAGLALGAGGASTSAARGAFTTGFKKVRRIRRITRRSAPLRGRALGPREARVEGEGPSALPRALGSPGRKELGARAKRGRDGARPAQGAGELRAAGAGRSDILPEGPRNSPSRFSFCPAVFLLP